MVRVTRAIERLASMYPGSCDPAAPRLIDVIHDNQSDFVLEGASAALEAIGTAAVQPMVQHVRDNDTSRRIYLTGSLGEIPTEEAAQALLDLLVDDPGVEEMHVSSLMDIGSASAIEPLHAQWEKEKDPGSLLAEALLVLCELNGVEKPALPQWRRAVAEQHKRMDDLRLHGFPAFGRSITLAGEEPPPPPVPDPRHKPKQRSVRAAKKVSKKERKKRARQRRRRKK